MKDTVLGYEIERECRRKIIKLFKSGRATSEQWGEMAYCVLEMQKSNYPEGVSNIFENLEGGILENERRNKLNEA